MEISCAFPPGPHAVDHIVEAERLGYERAWLFDSPALYGDIWVIAALAAERTTRIGLGPAVLVPNLRHPLTQASAIATLEQLAPGRVVAAIGTGFTGRMAMGKKPLTWAWTRRYIEQLRALLRGEKVEVDGAPRADAARPRFRAVVPDHHADRRRGKRPEGARRRARARRRRHDDRCRQLRRSTGVRSSRSAPCSTTGESPGSEPRARRGRARAHGRVPRDVRRRSGVGRRAARRRRVAQATGGGARRPSGISRCTRSTSSRVTERDRPLLDGDLLKAFTWTGEAAEVRTRIDALGDTGATEILYAPMGPDVPRELAPSWRWRRPDRARCARSSRATACRPDGHASPTTYGPARRRGRGGGRAAVRR